MKVTKPIKESWWDGVDFHIIYQDNDEHIVLRNATILKINDSSTGEISEHETYRYVKIPKKGCSCYGCSWASCHSGKE